MSFQAECSHHKLEMRRFADESARAAVEAKEINDVVNFMRVHTEQIIFEKEEYKKQLSAIFDYSAEPGVVWPPGELGLS
eukprot:12711787-Ditylum_brightwellii.AAC.1